MRLDLTVRTRPFVFGRLYSAVYIRLSVFGLPIKPFNYTEKDLSLENTWQKRQRKVLVGG